MSTDDFDHLVDGTELLNDLDRAAIDVLADAIASRLALQLAPGMGSMVVPSWAAATFEQFGRHGAHQARWHHSLGPDQIMFEALFTPRGTLDLTVIINAQRVWTGQLRGPLPITIPKETKT